MTNLEIAKRDYPFGTEYFPIHIGREYLYSKKVSEDITQNDAGVYEGFGYIYYEGTWARKVVNEEINNDYRIY